MNDAPRRGIRSLMWALLALLAGVPATAAAFGLDPATTAKVGAVCALFTGIFTAAINGLEDAGYLPALLKAPPSGGANPVPDPED